MRTLLFYEPCVLCKYPIVTPLEAGSVGTQETQQLRHTLPRCFFHYFDNESYFLFFCSHMRGISPTWELASVMAGGAKTHLEDHEATLHGAAQTRQKAKPCHSS